MRPCWRATTAALSPTAAPKTATKATTRGGHRAGGQALRTGSSAAEDLLQRLAHERGGVRDVDAGLLQRLHLLAGRALAARDDRASVTHPAPGRRRPPRDERDDGLLEVRADPGRGFLLGAPADLADHDDGLRLGVVAEERERVDEVRAVDRVAADPDAGRLPEAERRRLADGLVRERP